LCGLDAATLRGAEVARHDHNEAFPQRAPDGQI
jgi:hypothetical protein